MYTGGGRVYLMANHAPIDINLLWFQLYGHMISKIVKLELLNIFIRMLVNGLYPMTNPRYLDKQSA